MSRSHRKNPITGWAKADSERWWKRSNHRRLRTAVRGALARSADVMPALREVSNVYEGPKDGKQRFDPEDHPRMIRK